MAQDRMITFAGSSSAKPFVAELEKYFKVYQIPEEKKLLIAVNSLFGEAFDWYRIIGRRIFRQQPTVSFDDFKEKLIYAYSSFDRMDLERELFSVYQTEEDDPLEFVVNKVEQYREVYGTVNDVPVIRIIVRRMMPHWASLIYARYPNTVPELFDIIRGHSTIVESTHTDTDVISENDLANAFTHIEQPARLDETSLNWGNSPCQAVDMSCIPTKQSSNHHGGPQIQLDLQCDPEQSCIQPLEACIQLLGSSIQPPGSSIQPPGSSIQPPGSSIQPPGSSLQLLLVVTALLMSCVPVRTTDYQPWLRSFTTVPEELLASACNPQDQPPGTNKLFHDCDLDKMKNWNFMRSCLCF